MTVLTRATAFPHSRTVISTVAWAGIVAVVLAGCSPDAAGAPPQSAVAAESGDGAQPIDAGKRDLTLKIGSILPESGALAFLGPPDEAGVKLAVADVNAANTGLTIDATYRDSGDTTTDTATVSVTDLLAGGATAIVGAASSAVSMSVIDQITGAGAVHFSPANTSPDFTDYPDQGLFWRTNPSDLLQGEVLGNQIAEDGNSTLGLIVLNDSYGTALADATTAAFEGAGGEVVATSLFNEGEANFSSQIADVTAAKPDAIALITFDQAQVITPALVGTGFPGDQLYFVGSNLSDYSDTFEPGLITGATGTRPGAKQVTAFTDRLLELDPSLTDFTYAAESYDAVILLALAAYAGNDVSGRAIADNLRQVSGGTGDGTKVTDFADAAATLAAGEQIDYDGPSGLITFDEHGDPTEATIGVYEYGDDNTYSRIT
ncbi:ABC transporter substrate-binding protein [Cryobacterium arcticum]|uniref:Amino acid ABC transporter substrate-binding protein n=1 Tax=Cryobacterium arcticum TaxID=670052 RepID=A0A317ZW81_9MICO|nr:ABC transporter substrate-binding protein [Cryobacterium arcticum]PXA68437.1 amino acid ABC transporter substrate-binding protein [Cryobacterium arcticum]